MQEQEVVPNSILDIQVRLVDAIENLLENTLTAPELDFLKGEEKAQILIDVSANVLIHSIYRAIELPEHQAAYLEMILNTCKRQLESINVNKMAMGDFTLNEVEVSH